MSTAAPNVCQHTALCVDPSIYTAKTGYHRPSLQERLLAATSETSKSKRELISTSVEFIADHAYPAPLILPGDELACDPDYPKQSLRDWQLEGDRNPVTPKRNVVYVTAPLVDSKADYIQQWTQLEKVESDSSIAEPKLQDVIDYISAFYHGLSVKTLPIGTLCFTSWDESPTKGKGLNTASDTKKWLVSK
ncbi:hypothetical protein Ddc_17008 [Ditylenchus destructor]|nr:hypothetical protein Ddc_17008 [Ditylenchus destructor]